jgi:hypothetical protein
MPQRAYWIWELALGLALVAGFAAAGLDARREAGRGGRWKRRLLGAGLWAWAFLAVLPRARADEPRLLTGDDEKRAADPQLQEALARILVAQPGWEEVSEARAQAWDAVLESGPGKGPAPDALADLGERLEIASTRIEEIASRRALSPRETAYFQAELRFLREAVSALEAYGRNPIQFRRHEAPNASRLSFEYLRRLQPALEALIEADVVRGKVLEEILPRLDGAVAHLEEMEMRFRIAPRQFEKTRALRTEGARWLAKIRKVARPPLDRNPLWKKFQKAWDRTRACVSDPEVFQNLTAARKKRILRALKPAFSLIDALEREKVITPVEKKLLEQAYREDYDKVKKMKVVPLVDSGLPRPTCYTPVSLTTAPEVSARALKARLSTLRRLAEQDTVRQEVLVRLMETLEKHLRVLADPKLEKKHPKAEWLEFQRVFKQARALIREVKRR